MEARLLPCHSRRDPVVRNLELDGKQSLPDGVSVQKILGDYWYFFKV